MGGVILGQAEFNDILNKIRETAGNPEVSSEDLKTHVERRGYRTPFEELPEDVQDLERSCILRLQTCLEGVSEEGVRTALLARIPT